jgi:DNA-binding SARP family transcriptional activator
LAAGGGVEEEIPRASFKGRNAGVTSAGRVAGQVEFRILGPLEVWHEGRPVPVAGTTQRALLAVLLVHAGEVVSSDRLMDALWGDEQPATGATALRVRVSQLRRALHDRGELLVTQAPGYALRVGPAQLDLARFERLLSDGERALARGDAEAALATLREALALWRGAALADFAYAAFAQAPIMRLEELRLAALELRIEAELALGRHAPLTGELQALVAEHPLREGLCGQLMLALYRDGRQAEALAAYAAARTRLVEEIGIEPGPPLQALQQRILEQDPALGRDEPPPRPTAARTILVLPGDDDAIGPLCAIGELLAAQAGLELISIGLVRDAQDLAARTARLHEARAAAHERGIAARVAAFTSLEPGGDAVRLVTEQDVALLLLDAPGALLDTGIPDADLAMVMEQAVCDVALTVPRLETDGAVLVPFSGHQHDWAALELGAWLAEARGVPLRLAGVPAPDDGPGRDASRLLASASLALQRGMGVATESVLVAGGIEGILEAAEEAAFLVVGLSDRWAREGLGSARIALARRAHAHVVFVRRGLRPGGTAPPQALTRFTWSGIRG